MPEEPPADPADETAAELEELRHFQDMATAELDSLRPAALRESIRAAGADPDSPTGKTIIALAESTPSLRTSPRMVQDKIRKLGLPLDGQAAAATPYLDDPRPRPDLPHWAPQNTPGDPAYTVASKEVMAQRSREQRKADRAHQEEAEEQARLADEERARRGRELAPPEQQPTGGLTAEQWALLADEERSIDERIADARSQGDYRIASLLERQKAKEAAPR